MLERWPSLLCHCWNGALTLAKARIGFDMDDAWASHSYIPSLFGPSRSCAPVRRSFTTKEDGKNSMETLLELQSSETDKRFFFQAKNTKNITKNKGSRS